MVLHWAKETQTQSAHFHRCRYALGNENGWQTCKTRQLTESTNQVLSGTCSFRCLDLCYNMKAEGLIQRRQLQSSAEGVARNFGSLVRSLLALLWCFSLVPSFAFLLSCVASVLILHFSLAAFLQHLEDTFPGAGVHRGPGEPCTTQMVQTKNRMGDNTALVSVNMQTLEPANIWHFLLNKCIKKTE